MRDFFRKLPVRQGRIVKAHDPTSPTSRSKRYTEYDVLVDTRGEHEVSKHFLLSHCLVMSAFGGIADHSFWTPRVLNDVEIATYGLGTAVFVVLVDASAFGGLIVGGPQRQSDVTDSTKRQAVMEFNGIRTEIDDAGQFRITYRGRTSPNGDPENPVAPAGTTIEMTSDGKLKSYAPIDIELSAGVNMLLDAEGIISTSSKMVRLGDATDQMVMGTTYRVAETSANMAIAAAWSSVVVAMSALGALAVALDPTGVTTTSCTTAATAAGAAATAISSFEAASPSYLSTKNWLDR